eukprot:707651-Rhodomonas_salina.1
MILAFQEWISSLEAFNADTRYTPTPKSRKSNLESNTQYKSTPKSSSFYPESSTRTLLSRNPCGRAARYPPWY